MPFMNKHRHQAVRGYMCYKKLFLFALPMLRWNDWNDWQILMSVERVTFYQSQQFFSQSPAYAIKKFTVDRTLSSLNCHQNARSPNPSMV